MYIYIIEFKDGTFDMGNLIFISRSNIYYFTLAVNKNTPQINKYH